MLTDNPRFQKEYQDFAEKISRIDDDGIRLQMNQMLMKLVREVQFLDKQHEELASGAKLSSDVLTDHRSSLKSIRQQIVKKIEECSKAGMIKN